MITIVIPTFNEASNIEKLISLIKKVKLKEDVHILFVDDNSPDGTGKLLDKFAKRDKKIDVIHRKNERGLGSAYVRGFKEALKTKSRVIFGMDADLSHDPQAIPLFLRKIDEGCDVVQGSRYIKGASVDWSFHRKIISRGANMLSAMILGLNLHDVTNSYKAYKNEALQKIDLDKIKSNGFSFFEEILYMCKLRGFKLGEVPIIFKDRVRGKSKLSKIEMAKFFITLIKLRIFTK